MRLALAFGLLLLGFVLGCPESARADSAVASLAARLGEIRDDPTLSSDPAAIEGLAVLAADAPATSVRAEARMVVAEAWLGRLNRTEDAVRMMRLVASDPEADALTARLAEREIVDVLIARGEIQSAVREVSAHESLVDPKFARQVRKLERRVWLRATALGVIGAFASLATLALVRAKRRRTLGPALAVLRGFAPVAVSFAAFVGITGGLLASQFEAGNATPFLFLGAAVAPLALLGRTWGAVGSAHVAARAGRAFACAASTLSTAFVLLDYCNPMYLEGFGL
jgi:hypothetical protein